MASFAGLNATLAPLPLGLMDRGGPPGASFPMITSYVLNVRLEDLMPTPDAVVTTAPTRTSGTGSAGTALSTRLATLRAAGFSCRLRIFAGYYSPGWLKYSGGAPVTAGDANTAGRWWTAQYVEGCRWANMILAATYDEDPAVGEVALFGPMSEYAEPFQRQSSDLTFQAGLLAAGYTKAADIAAHNSAITHHATYWRRTRTTYACNPLQCINQGIVVESVDTSTDRVTVTGHGLGNTTEIRFSGSDLPAPLVAGTWYYVRSGTANDFQVAATSGGAAINLTSAGSGTTMAAVTTDVDATKTLMTTFRNTLGNRGALGWNNERYQATSTLRADTYQGVAVTADITTDRFTLAGHELSNDQPVRFAGTLPTGIVAATTYYVAAADRVAGTFKVATAAGAGPIDLTVSNGSGITLTAMAWGAPTVTLAVHLAAAPYSDSPQGTDTIAVWNHGRDLGGPIYVQSSTDARIGDVIGALENACGHGASSYEASSGYDQDLTGAAVASLTVAEATTYDAVLRTRPRWGLV